MASIEEGGGGGHKKGPGVKKAKKLSTHLDMTPMVDLGFLLITFFIFTTTMSSPTTMELYMPKDTDKDDDQNKAKESGALTVMLSKDNHVYYYEGQLTENASNFKQATFGFVPIIEPNGDSVLPIRTVILRKKKEVIDAHQHDAGCEKIWAKNGGDKKSCLDKDLVVVIKPGELATYKNTVDILDEMTISNIKRYAMVDLYEVEKTLISKTEGN